MTTGARVESIDAIKAFKVQLLKFAEAAVVALGDAESDMHRTLMWLELEAVSHWQGQIRKRTELLSRAQEAYRQKTIFKDATGRQQSAVDEMKAVQLAKRRLEEANEKLALTKQYTRRLQKEIELYKGGVQRFSTSVQSEVPGAAAKLERMVTTLEGYVALTVEDVARAAGEEFSQEMTRAAAEAAGFGAAGAGDSGGADEESAAEPPGPGRYGLLRTFTPTGHLRESAGPALMSTAGWGTRTLGQQDRAALAALPGERLPLDPAERLIVGRGTVESPTIYLERVEGRGPGDSQWYVGPAEGRMPEAIDAVAAADFLAVRPDLRDALTLPKGSLIALGTTGVLAVLDARDEDLWATKPQPAAPGRVGAMEREELSLE